MKTGGDQQTYEQWKQSCLATGCCTPKNNRKRILAAHWRGDPRQETVAAFAVPGAPAARHGRVLEAGGCRLFISACKTEMI
jgi:hypothetical protein